MTETTNIRTILENASTIAVVGLSPQPWRDSHRVSRFMKAAGYRILPVRPGETEILGEKAYPRLEDIPVPVDIVNIFRRSDKVLAHAVETLALSPHPSAVWMQEGVVCEESLRMLTKAGIDVIMDRCIMVDYARFVEKNRI